MPMRNQNDTSSTQAMSGYVAFHLFLLIGIILVPHVCAENNTTLPDLSYPKILKYGLHITLPQTMPELMFKGVVTVFFSNPSDADPLIIVLNAKDMDITNVTVGDTKIAVQNELKDDTLRLILTGAKDKDKFQLIIHYEGEINTIPKGLYASSYLHDSEEVWYIASLLKPKSPDLLFPCFPDPKDNATVEMKITHNADYKVISINTANKTVKSNRNNIITTSFAVSNQTLPAYMVGLVACKFNSHTMENNLTIPHKIWYRPKLENMYQYAANLSQTVLRTIANNVKTWKQMLGTNNSMELLNLLPTLPSKLDQIALPDLPDSAVEQWSLLTYREDALLCDEQQAGAVAKQKIALTIMYSMVRMTVGLLPTQWDNMWIMEAWATLNGYYGLNLVNPDWETQLQFVVEILQAVMVEDASIHSTTLHWSPQKPPDGDSARAQSGTFVKAKGAAILRMMVMISGVHYAMDELSKGDEVKIEEEDLDKIIKLYEMYKTKRDPEILFNILLMVPRGLMQIGDTFPAVANVTTVLKNWIRAKGFPIVNVARKGKKIELSAKRFVYKSTSHESLDNIWYIPISYTTSKNPDFAYVGVKYSNWIIGKSTLIIHEDLSDGISWIVVNLQSAAYLRVNYDNNLWKNLGTALKNNHLQIHVLNRAQIVDDLLELARVGELSYSIAIDILQYLKNEIEYHPWYSALRGFNRLTYRLHKKSHRNSLQKFVRGLLTKVYNTVSNSTGHLSVLAKVLVKTTACKMKSESCKKEMTKAFEDFIKTDKEIDPDMRPLAFCMGLKSKPDWDFLYSKLDETNVPSDRTAIIEGLGCIRDVEVLNSYLKEPLNFSSPIRSCYADLVFKSVAENSVKGTDAALNFFVNNSKDLVEHFDYSDIIPNMLHVLGTTIRTDTQLDKLEAIKLEQVMGNFTIPLMRAISQVRENLYWERNRRNDFIKALPTTTTRGTVNTGTMWFACVSQTLFFVFAIIVIP